MTIIGNVPPVAMKRLLAETMKAKSAVVQFTKLNGEVRTMFATLKPALLPAREGRAEASKARKQSERALPVFDLELQQWRSFRLDRLHSVTVF
jgi:hypothetical protein